jgi:hypothetical protein
MAWTRVQTLPQIFRPFLFFFYEIVTNVWVQVNPGDTVSRPLSFDINWGACSSYVPDGTIAEIRLFDGRLTQLSPLVFINQTH